MQRRSQRPPLLRRVALGSCLVAAALVPLLPACREGRPAGTVVFDFAGDLDFAAIEREVTDLQFGTPATRAHLGEGWSVDETTPKGRPFTWSDGEESSLDFYLAHARPLRLRFTCEPLTGAGLPPQALAVTVNGRRREDIDLPPGPRRYWVSLPADALVAGRNRVVFRYRWTHRPADDGAASPDRRRLGVAWYELGFGTGGAPPPERPRVEGEKTLLIPVGTEVAYQLLVPEGSWLSADAVRLGARGGGELAVLLQPDGEPEREVARLTRPAESWTVALTVAPGTYLRIAFRARPGSGAAGTEPIRLVQPALRRGPATAGATDVPTPPRARRPHVFVYLVDALRADHLGCYGYRRPVSPRVDAFAKEATLFRGIAPSSWTKASVASLLTGRSPIVHRAQDRGDTLVPEAVTLPEVLGAEGYRTYALYANTWVGEPFGLDQGFAERRFLDARSDRLTRELVAWLRRQAAGDRLFVYVHTIDPHAPYEPTPEYRRRFAPGAKRTRITPEWLENVAARARGGEPLPPGLVAEATALYDAEIAFNDRQFGLFLDELRRLGLYDDSLVVFTADHGEEFFEHGGVSHGHTLFREVLEVPLIVKWPSGVVPAPGASGSRAQLLDVLPTVLDVVGLPSPPGIEGRSLRRAPRTDVRPGGNGILSYLDLDGQKLQAVTQGRWKLIRTGGLDEPGAMLRLYDMSSQGEANDTRPAHPVVALHLAGQLAAAVARRPAGTAPPQAEVPPEVLDRLRALGYVH